MTTSPSRVLCLLTACVQGAAVTEPERSLPSSSMAGHTSSSSVSTIFTAIGRHEDEDVDVIETADQVNYGHEQSQEEQSEEYEQDEDQGEEQYDGQEEQDDQNYAESNQEAQEEDEEGVAQSNLGHIHSVEEIDEGYESEEEGGPEEAS